MHLQLAVVAEVRGGGELRGRAFYRPSEDEGKGERDGQPAGELGSNNGGGGERGPARPLAGRPRARRCDWRRWRGGGASGGRWEASSAEL